MEQPATVEAGEVEIDVAVVVDVSRCHAKPEPGRVDAALRRYVREMERPGTVSTHLEIVPVEASSQRRIDGATTKRSPLHEIDIQVAIVVVVEEGDAWRQDLRVVELAGGAVHVS